jgi:hypothetical protein
MVLFIITPMLDEIGGKAAEARKLVADLSKDIDKVLSMAEFSVPAGKEVARKIVERMEEIKKLFRRMEDGPS